MITIISVFIILLCTDVSGQFPPVEVCEEHNYCMFINDINNITVLAYNCIWTCLTKYSENLQQCITWWTSKYCITLAENWISELSNTNMILPMQQTYYPSMQNYMQLTTTFNQWLAYIWSVAAEYCQCSGVLTPLPIVAGQIGQYDFDFSCSWAPYGVSPMGNFCSGNKTTMYAPTHISVCASESKFGMVDSNPYLTVAMKAPTNGSNPTCYEGMCYLVYDWEMCVYCNDSVGTLPCEVNNIENVSQSTCSKSSTNNSLVFQLSPNSVLPNCVICQFRGACPPVTGEPSPKTVTIFDHIRPFSRLLIAHGFPWSTDNSTVIYNTDTDGLSSFVVRDVYNGYDRYIDYDSFGEVLRKQSPFCIDWIGQYNYTLEQPCTVSPERGNCISQTTNNQGKKQILYSIGASKFGQILCLPFWDIVVVTFENVQAESWNFVIMGYASSAKPKIICQVNVSSPAVAFDWQRFHQNGKANFFVINNENMIQMLSLDVETQTCLFGNTLKFNLSNLNVKIMSADWTYLYFTDGQYLQMLDYQEMSFSTVKVTLKNPQDVDEALVVQPSGMYDLVHITDLKAFLPEERPFAPVECVFPVCENISNYQMINDNTFAFTVAIKWNSTVPCYNASKPPVILTITNYLQFSPNASSVQTKLTRNENIQFKIAGLNPGEWYNLTVSVLPAVIASAYNASPSTILLLYQANFKPFNKTQYWPFAILAVVVVVVVGLMVFYYKQIKPVLRMIDKLSRICSHDISWIKVIGSGHFGEVWLGSLHQESKGKERDVALKEPSNSEAKRCLLEEAILLSSLNHDNIIKVFGICMQGGNPFKIMLDYNHRFQDVVLVFEYMNGESCKLYFVKNYNTIALQSVLLIAKDILKACVHLETVGYVHRDIAARNVLLKLNKSKNIELAKLADFGLAKDISGYGVYKPLKNEIFPRRITAPEGWRGEFTNKSDVWSFGIFVWEMFAILTNGAEVCAYEHIQETELETEICEHHNLLDKPHKCPQKLYDLLRKMWDPDQRHRPSFTELLASNCFDASTYPEEENFHPGNYQEPSSYNWQIDSDYVQRSVPQ